MNDAIGREQHPGDLVEHARRYAERGWAVFPLWWSGPDRPCACPDPDCGQPDPERPGRTLGSPAKHPHGGLAPHGFGDASTDRLTIERWWRTAPGANVGIRTGAASGLVVLDVDGAEGEASLRQLVELHGRFRALWVRTGSGGWHAYLAHPREHVGNSARKLGRGLDVRGDGGYVVAPPSLHVSGQRYTWTRGGPGPILPPLPAWMLELLTAPPAPAAPRALQLRGQALTPYVLAAVEGESREVALAPAGQRNQRLNGAAYRLGQLVGAGLVPEAAVTEILLAAAQTAGLGDRESQATVRSGLRAGARHPRDLVS